MTPALRVGVVAVAVLAGCGGEKIQTNKELPVATFTAKPTAARPQVIELDASESFATVGRIARYRWTFGDENGAEPTERVIPTEVHTYATAGTFTITLVVFDELGAASEPVSRDITIASVNTDPPRALIFGPDSASPGMAVFFDGSASTPQGDLLSYLWDFGDPASGVLNTSDAISPSHTFLTPGNYRVRLTVTDSLGQSDTAEHLIAVGQVGPVAHCTFSPNPALQGVPVTFDGTGSTAPGGAAIKTWVWDFDDGSPGGTGATVMHTYNVQATFRPTLQVIDTQNRVAEVTCPDVVVQAPPLCSGDYAIEANPKSQVCGGISTVTWAGVEMSLVQNADGTLVASETFNSQTITYSGTWAGLDFTLTGSYSQETILGTILTRATINGTFTGCGTWSGTWVEEQTLDMIGPLCTLTWNVTGTKL